MLCSCSVLNEWIFIIPVNTPTQICASIAIKKDEGWLAFATTLYPGSISKWVNERSQPVWWYTNELFFEKVQIVPWSLPDFEAPHWNSRITKSPPPANSVCIFLQLSLKTKPRTSYVDQLACAHKQFPRSAQLSGDVSSSYAPLWDLGAWVICPIWPSSICSIWCQFVPGKENFQLPAVHACLPGWGWLNLQLWFTPFALDSCSRVEEEKGRMGR